MNDLDNALTTFKTALDQYSLDKGTATAALSAVDTAKAAAAAAIATAEAASNTAATVVTTDLASLQTLFNDLIVLVKAAGLVVPSA